MVIGLILRNFKTYRGINFIPFIIKDLEHLQIFIGDNGTGKSSILEALNAYFHDDTKWIQTTGQKDSYVAPLMLLEKNKYAAKFSPKSLEIVEKISAFLWDFNSEGNTIYSQVQGMIDFKNSIKNIYQQSHYLLLLGNRHDERSSLYFGTFDKEIKTKVLGFEWDEGIGDLRKKTDQNTVNKVMYEHDQMMTFIYIPAEANIAQFLKLESSDMQELVNRKIKEDIETILKKPYSESSDKNNIIDYINNELMPYIEEVQKTIQKIDPTYRFKGDNRSVKLNSRDLIAPIIRAFYSKRRLEKNNKPIDDLSSGERKKALVDIVFSFLSQRGDKEKDIVFAIDEPESSLDTENKFDSFHRIEKIANGYKHQTFITTHWYGLLPIVHKGIIHCLELSGTDEIKPIVKKYDARYFISERRKEPDDNYFKSYSDLASSIFSSLRSKNINWLIVEGVDDRNYLDYYLRNLIDGYNDNLRILAVGGSGNVKLLYEHLFIPIANSNAEKIKGNVLCLVDKDEGNLETYFESKTENKKLQFKRLQHVKGEIILINVDNKNLSEKTLIEDSLEPQLFYTAMKNTIESTSDEALKAAFKNFKFNENATTSKVAGDKSILSPVLKNGTNPEADKQLIIGFINKLSVKEKLSNEYCSLEFEKSKVPEWMTKHLLKSFYDEIPFIKEATSENSIDENPKE